jgi:hypothetical protein
VIIVDVKERQLLKDRRFTVYKGGRDDAFRKEKNKKNVNEATFEDSASKTDVCI